MSLKKLTFSEKERPEVRALKELYNKRADEIDELEMQQTQLENQNQNEPGNNEDIAEAIKLACDKILADANEIMKVLESLQTDENEARGAFNIIRTYSLGSAGKEEKRGLNTANEREVRAFQKFISNGIRGITDTEQRALTLSGSAAVVPKTIADTMIMDQKYSDLLHLANVFEMPHMGKLSIPIASNGSAEVHTEGEPIGNGTPAMSYLELTGYEVVGMSTISRAVADMATESFQEKMLDFVSAEVIEKLEDLFINGTGSAQPKGLVNLTWNTTAEAGQNAIQATTAISIADIAAALALLPQRYARNAVILCNTKTYYDLMVSKDTAGQYVFNASSGSETILGKTVVLSELVPASTIFVVDPHENYVNFACPLQAESDASSGFTKHEINIKAWATMDSAWNPAACVRITAE